MHRNLCNGRVRRLFHRHHQQFVCLRSALFGPNVIRRVEIQWVHLVHLHELQNLHYVRRRRLNLVELLLREQHILILFVLVALHNFRAFHISVARRAHQRLLQPRIAHFVQLIEADSFAARGREQTHRYRN